MPLIFQLLILEFAIDGLRLAAVNTPSMLTTPLSVIAGIVLGEYSVKSGWFNSETMLYMAFVTIANYSQASFELGYALKFMRVILLILTSLFNVWGYHHRHRHRRLLHRIQPHHRRKELYLSADPVFVAGDQKEIPPGTAAAYREK